MYQCPLCEHNFSRRQRLESHLKRKTPCNQSNNDKKLKIKLKSDIIICQHCKKTFARKDNLTRHQKIFCEKNRENTNELSLGETVTMLAKQINELKNDKQKTDQQIAELKEKQAQEITELKERPPVNQVLQVICIGGNDNYLDMLTSQWNNFDKALEYIKDCALSSLTGDCFSFNSAIC